MRPAPQPTLEPEGDYLQSTWKRSVYPLAEKFGVSIKLPKVSPQPHTHLAFEGFQYAKLHGKADEYNHRMFTAFFQDELDIGDIEVLTKLATEIGLNGNEFKKVLEERIFKKAHQDALRHAIEEARIQVVPTIRIGTTILQGLYSKEALEQMVDEQLKLWKVTQGQAD